MNTAGESTLAANESEENLERVLPQLKDLLRLARHAASLPSWSQRRRARHSGTFLSTVRGRGMEYDESRPYQPGDDIRHLDWRVTARSGRAHTKLFREERERPIFTCVDYRHSMYFATRGVFKSVLAARLAALVAWRAQQNGDRIGGVIFGDSEHRELPPRRGKAAAMHSLKPLVELAPGSPALAAGQTTRTKLSAVFARLRRIAKPGSLIFVFSDFRGLDDEAITELVLLGRHADIGLVIISDPLEQAFPEVHGDAIVTDRTQRIRLDGLGDNQKQDYRELHEKRVDAVFNLAREQRYMAVEASTADEPLSVLIRLLGRAA